MSHAAGVGPAFPREVVRAMLLLRANTLALGHSGCRPLIVDRLLDFLRLGLHPVVPEQGSVGASGDLAPLAHLALPLIGRGQVELGGQVLPGLLGAARGRPGAADPRGQGGPGAPQRDADDERARGAVPGRRRPARPDGQRGRRAERRGAARDGRRVRRRVPAGAAASGPDRRRRRAAPPAPRLAGSSGATTGTPTRSRTRTHCAACRRCTARSATRSTTCAGCSTSSSTRPPTTRSSSPAAASPTPDTIATGGGRVISGGNFHGEPIALALDFAKLAVAELGSISERRTALLVDARLNGGLPPFLAPAVGRRLRDDDLPVHGGGPRLRAQGPRPSGVGRLDPDVRQPGGPRLDGLDRGPARTARCSRASNGSSPSSCSSAAQALDLPARPAMRPPRGARAGARGRCRARPTTGSVPASAISTATASRARPRRGDRARPRRVRTSPSLVTAAPRG